MIKTGCEVFCMSWDSHEILSVGILKNLIPNLEIKFVDNFTNDPRTWKIDFSDGIYREICKTYHIDKELADSIDSKIIEKLICEIEPKTSIFDIWKEGFLYAVDIVSMCVKAKNFKQAMYHSCLSCFEDAEDGYALIEDEDSPWEEIVKDYPDIKFVIIDMRKSHEHEKDPFGVENSDEDLRYKVKPICENQEFRIPVFRNDDILTFDPLIGDLDTNLYSVIEPKKSWKSFTLLRDISFEYLSDAENFVESMIKKYNKYIEANKDMKGE